MPHERFGGQESPSDNKRESELTKELSKLNLQIYDLGETGLFLALAKDSLIQGKLSEEGFAKLEDIRKEAVAILSKEIASVEEKLSRIRSRDHGDN